MAKHKKTGLASDDVIPGVMHVHRIHVAAALGNKDQITLYLAAHPQLLEVRDKMGRTPLMYSVLGGSHHTIAFLLKAGASTTSRDISGSTPLHIAVQKNARECAKTLLLRGARWDVGDKEGSTSLHLAARHTDAHILKLIIKQIKKKQQIELLDSKQACARTALHYASACGNWAALAYLLKHGANVGASDNEGRTPTHLAALAGATKCLERLLEVHPSSLLYQDNEGRTPLHLAVMSEDIDTRCLLLLVSRAASERFNAILTPLDAADHVFQTPLHLAAAMGHADACLFLLKAGADPALVDSIDFTPLHLAAARNHPEAVQVFLLQNAVQKMDWGACESTPLHAAAETGATASLEVLLSSGCFPHNTLNAHQATALHVAAREGQSEILQTLLAAGASVEAKDRAGMTPLAMAAEAGQSFIMEELLLANADPEVMDSLGQNVLHHAVTSGKASCVTLLLRHGTNVNTRTHENCTALHLAAAAGHEEIASLLISAGTTVDSRDSRGLTPLHLAAMEGHIKVIVTLILFHGAPINTLGFSYMFPRPTPLDLAIAENQAESRHVLLQLGGKTGAEVALTAACIIQKCYRARRKRGKAFHWYIMLAKLKGLRAPPPQSSYSPMPVPGAHSPRSPAAPLVPVSPKRGWMSQGNEDKTKKKPDHLMPPGLLQPPLPIQMPRASSTSQLQDLLSNLSDSAMNVRICETPGCNSEASLQCPTCLKLGIAGSFFCSQTCFKSYWSEHKVIHKVAKGEGGKGDCKNEGGGDVPENYNPWPYYSFTGKLRPWPVTPGRVVSDHIPRPDYADHPQGHSLSEQSLRGNTVIKVLTDEEQEGLRVACKLGREVLDEAAQVVDLGVTTDEIDRIVHEATIDRECYPSPLNYYNFPKSCCTSVNEVICHGIPDSRPLRDGDIMNVDVTVYHRGFHGDLNETFLIGNVSDTAKRLVKTTWECLQNAIAMVRPGVRYREVGNVIQKHAQSEGFSVVRSYCGHGIHRLFHTAPNVPHYAKNKAIGVMKPGHVFTIEPMISEGTWRDQLWPDDWTSVTQDGKLSAQFEHTLLVTDDGCDVLTRRLTEDGLPHFMAKL